MIRHRPAYVHELAAPRRGPRLFRRLREGARRLYHERLCRKCSSGLWRWFPLASDPHHHMRVPNLRLIPGTAPTPRDERSRRH
ncbi:hypothetical protein [Vulgatibacter sp.]|uniref:hypothetical protein n=1 Tax=Vulgatibacter sp. TaxID=1971226 RepID=UPI003563FB32